MATYISASLRKTVTARANNCCEYCGLPSIASFVSFQMEHIIAEKHGGATSETNLALACATCNLHKGSDIASIDPESGIIVAFYNPRTDKWSTHFQFSGGLISPITATGRVTVKILQLNTEPRVRKRALLIQTTHWVFNQ